MDTNVNVELYDADVAELFEALDYQFRHNRSYWVKNCDKVDIWNLIRFLEDSGCPREIIERLDAWEKEHIPNQVDLARWIKF